MPTSSWSDLLARAARAALSILSSSGTTSSGSGSSGAGSSVASSSSSGRAPSKGVPSSGRPGRGSVSDVGRHGTTDGGRPPPTGGNGPSPKAGGATPPARPTGSHDASVPSPRESVGYPGDFRGRVDPVYSPELDGDADPGEIVWTWVPYEEDHSQGKDRPVLVVGHDGGWLLGLMLTSKDNTRKQRTDGPRWWDIGAGPWDARGRDSEVRLDRVLRLDPDAVRREGAIMDRATFDEVVGQL